MPIMEFKPLNWDSQAVKYLWSIYLFFATFLAFRVQINQFQGKSAQILLFCVLVTLIGIDYTKKISHRGTFIFAYSGYGAPIARLIWNNPVLLRGCPGEPDGLRVCTRHIPTPFSCGYASKRPCIHMLLLFLHCFSSFRLFVFVDFF